MMDVRGLFAELKDESMYLLSLSNNLVCSGLLSPVFIFSPDFFSYGDCLTLAGFTVFHYIKAAS